MEGEEPLLTTLFVNLIGNSLKFRRPDGTFDLVVVGAFGFVAALAPLGR